MSAKLPYNPVHPSANIKPATGAEAVMRRDEALSILRAHEAELRASGVLHVRLFGSVARDEATDASDVDVLVDFAPGLTLLDISRVRLELSDLLLTDVDLTSELWLKERVRARANREAVLAF